jgi:signal transduction histidine kinase
MQRASVLPARRRRSCKRLERLIQEVLLFARGESIGRDTIPAAELLADAAQTVQPLFLEKGCLPGDLPTLARVIVTGSRKALAGALVNLLENALQACTVGGQVTLSASESVGRQLRISVRDTGSGIAPEVQLRVFEPFFTTRGTGHRARSGDRPGRGAHTRRDHQCQFGAGRGFGVRDPACRSKRRQRNCTEETGTH